MEICASFFVFSAILWFAMLLLSNPKASAEVCSEQKQSKAPIMQEKRTKRAKKSRKRRAGSDVAASEDDMEAAKADPLDVAELEEPISISCDAEQPDSEGLCCGAECLDQDTSAIEAVLYEPERTYSRSLLLMQRELQRKIAQGPPGLDPPATICNTGDCGVRMQSY